MKVYIIDFQKKSYIKSDIRLMDNISKSRERLFDW